MAAYVKDFLIGAHTHSECIHNCLTHCKKNGETTIIFDDINWFIDESILLHSGMTVILDGCMIKQNNYVFDTVFRGDNVIVNPDDPYGIPLDVRPIRDIKILGKNDASIVGCDINRIGFHSVMQENQEMTGDFWGWRTLQISLSRCDGFEISGISFSQTRCWALSFDHCENGWIHNLQFETECKNGDGIDFRMGCHHCRVEHITGFTADDTVACTAVYHKNVKYPQSKYLYPMEPGIRYADNISLSKLDIHHISISDIYTSGYHHGVICLSAGGVKVHHIDISNVVEFGSGNREATVKIYTGYGGGYQKNDLSDISVSNITSKIADYTVLCNAKMDRVNFRSIKQENPAGACFNISIPEGITYEDDCGIFSNING